MKTRNTVVNLGGVARALRVDSEDGDPSFKHRNAHASPYALLGSITISITAPASPSVRSTEMNSGDSFA